jgi:hypothetical protein
MTANVLIETEPDGQVRATLLGWPDATVHGATEDDALARLRQLLAARLTHARIVPLEVEVTSMPHPWLALADRLGANPLWEKVAAAIATARDSEPPA